MRHTTNISKGSFDVDNFSQHGIVDASFEADTVAEGQADIDGETLKVAIWVNVGVFLDIIDEFGDTVGRFEVDEG